MKFPPLDGENKKVADTIKKGTTGKGYGIKLLQPNPSGVNQYQKDVLKQNLKELEAHETAEVKITFRVPGRADAELDSMIAEIKLAAGIRITKNQLGVTALRMLLESWKNNREEIFKRLTTIPQLPADKSPGSMS